MSSPPIKRSPDLRDLSVDHHHGLLLARKAKMVAAGQDDTPLPEMWKEIDEKFRFELSPHFKVEEDTLVPSLRSHGKDPLVRRLLEEHAELRQCVSPESGRTSDDLSRFGILLENHIRFEERELFGVAQEILTPEELAAVASASRARWQ